LRWGWAAILLAIVRSCAVAVDLTKDDIDFRKEVYVNKKGDKLPYGPFAPIGYSSANTYPLVFWLHGGEGNDNVKQITHGNEKGTHLWISSEVPSKLPALVLAPQCPVGENWCDSELNQPTNASQLALEILASAEKQFAIDPDRVYAVGQSMGGLGVWPLLQTHPENGRSRWFWRVTIISPRRCPTAGFACGCFKDMPAGAFPRIWCGK
jgi:predicted peptidase